MRADPNCLEVYAAPGTTAPASNAPSFPGINSMIGPSMIQTMAFNTINVLNFMVNLLLNEKPLQCFTNSDPTVSSDPEGVYPAGARGLYEERLS
jgi:hypothetical protein